MTQKDSAKSLLGEINRIRDIPGCVYMVRNRDLYKIGITISLERRMKQLKPDEIVETMQIPNTRGAEKILHARFRDKRIPQTEYFRLSAEEVEEARFLFKSVRGEAIDCTSHSARNTELALREVSSLRRKIEFSGVASKWIEIIEQVSESCEYEQMLWTETTSSTGKVLTGSYYILNASEEECLLPRSEDLLEGVKRIESKDDYLIPVAKAETEQEASSAALTLIGDLLLALCWGYWQGLFNIQTKNGEHPKEFILTSEEMLRQNSRWYTIDSPTRRKRLERMRGWKG